MILGKDKFACIGIYPKDTGKFCCFCQGTYCKDCICRKLYNSGIQTGDVYLKSGAVVILLEEESYG